MKKTIIILAALVCASSLFAASYGILVNGKTYFAGESAGEYEGFTQYLAHVQVKNGDYCQLYDAENKAAWAVDLNSYSVSGFTRNDNKYNVAVDGCYDFYIKLKWEADELYIGNGSNCGTGEDISDIYTGSVPPQCTDVMMQAFFNESYRDDAPGVGDDQYHLNLGNTKWATLLPQAAEIGKYIDLVWLPPSAYGDGMGYHPKQYSNQNSNWGTREELDALIDAFHKAGAKVVADIVINHCAGWTSWCDFPEMDFGEYGKFQPDGSYICKNDEVNLNPDAGECYGKATGNNDDGDNWDGARDWAHDNVYVQDMFKAYLKWMRNVMKYDGFRYDKGDGFNNWHHDNYNKAAKPYIAFMECYCGDDKIIDGIKNANYNLMGLDFQTKWQAFDAMAGFDYSKCQGSGLLGRGYAKYAVTFIESHDWFLRPDNENEFGGRGNSLTAELKDRLLQANAFLLSMPGVPCVFYPHWAKYKDELKPMIDARKLAGVHSESQVSDEQADHDGYQCTLKGKYGWLILQLGNKTKHDNTGDNSWLGDYKLMAKGNGYAIWVNRTEPIGTGFDCQSPVAGIPTEKYIQDGKMFIRCGERVYDIFGNVIK
ncbi:MAG: hypothetical protein IJT12_01825 [Paludibacteraceae bacterium]|nr:hypothetical protein [Paludibacteraceae bacterium]